MQHSFEHLVDYDCRYYTYQYSLAIVKDLASKFMRCVPTDPDDIGYEYRKTILEPGSTMDATELVKRFLGREYTMEAFYKWLEDRPLDRV
jgi:thimet oligopeptidase